MKALRSSFRLYTLNAKHAKQKAPKFYKAFETWMNENRPIPHNAILEVRAAYQQFITMPSSQSMVEHTVYQDKRSFAKQREVIEDIGVKGWMSALISEAHRSFVNPHQPLKRVMKTMVKNHYKKTGRRLAIRPGSDPVKLLRLAIGSDAMAKSMLQDGVREYKTENISGPSVTDALEKAFGKKRGWTQRNFQMFDTYLEARRGVQLWKKYNAGDLANPPMLHNAKEVATVVREREAKFPEFVEAAKMLYEYQDNVLKLKRDAGLISDELYVLLSKQKDYVPFQRDTTGMDKLNEGNGSQSSQPKRMMGSDRAIKSPIENILRDAFATMQDVSMNEAMGALIGISKTVGGASDGLVEKLPKHKIQGTDVDTLELIKKQLAESGADPDVQQGIMDELTAHINAEDTARMYKKVSKDYEGKPVVFHYEKGERVPYRVGDPKAAMSIHNLLSNFNNEQLHWIGGIMGKPASLLRAGITSHPAFIISNGIRGEMQAAIANPGYIPFYSGAKGLKSELTQDEQASLYSAFGGIMGGEKVANMDSLKIKSDIKALERKGYNIRMANPKDPIGMFKRVLKITEVSETAMRFGIMGSVYKSSKKRGMSGYHARTQAVYESRDIADYGLIGARVRELAKSIPFFNATIQAMSKGVKIGTADGMIFTDMKPYLETIYGNRPKTDFTPDERFQMKRAAFYHTAMLGVGLFGLMIRMAHEDDEDYMSHSEYARATHWPIKTGDKEYVYLPKPFENAAYSNMMEAAYERMVLKDKTAFKRWVRSHMHTHMISYTAPAVSLPVELATNHNFYRDSPIVPTWEQNREAEDQYNEYTTEMAKRAGKALNLSPYKVDHFVNGLGGTYGRDIGRQSNKLDPERPSTDLTSSVFTSRFFKKAGRGSREQSAFYDLIAADGTFSKASGSLKLKVDKGENEAAIKHLQEKTIEEASFALVDAMAEAKDKRLHPMRRAQDTARVVSEINKQMQKEEIPRLKGKSFKLDNDTRRDAIDALAQYRAGVMRNALKRVNEDGWAQRKDFDEDAALAEIFEISPELGKEFKARRRKLKISDFSRIDSNYEKHKKISAKLADKLGYKPTPKQIKEYRKRIDGLAK